MSDGWQLLVVTIVMMVLQSLSDRSYCKLFEGKNGKLLKAENGHVFLLNEIRKGHREWVCFSTGELIRPAIIFDA